jgi:hypothetical protein
MMEIYNKFRRLIFEMEALPVYALVVLAGIIVVITFVVSGVESIALYSFLGVIIGSAFTSLASLLIAKENRRGPLAIASLDKRLETHQKAYALWHEIVASAVRHPDLTGDFFAEADKFWKNNCLYLDPASRKAFRDCIIFASSHIGLLPPTEGTRELIKESWDIITKPGKLLVEGVALPSLGEKEYSNEVKDT